MSTAWEEELGVLKAVYGDDNVEFNESLRRLIVTVGSTLVVRCEVPLTYPLHAPPRLIGVLNADLITSEIFRPGEQILFQLIEKVRELHLDTLTSVQQAPAPTRIADESPTDNEPVHVARDLDSDVFTTGEHIIVSKSRFVAHVARCRNPGQAADLLRCVRLSKFGKATHNIWAFRLADGKANNDDDGEDAAGGRLAELLHVLRMSDIIVVVSRFYGGINLGPQRFKLINQAARSAIDKFNNA